MLIQRGMGGTDLTTPQLIGTTGSVAGSALPLLLPLFGVAGPLGLAVGAAVAGATALLSAFGVGGGCGQSCIAASQNADQIEAAMKANLVAFQAGNIGYDEAIANFEALWHALSQACGQIGGDAGRNCVADRQEGACKWRDAKGECWNWFTGYREPIASARIAGGDGGGSPVVSLASAVSGAPTWKLALLGLVGGLVVSEVVS